MIRSIKMLNHDQANTRIYQIIFNTIMINLRIILLNGIENGCRRGIFHSCYITFVSLSSTKIFLQYEVDVHPIPYKSHSIFAQLKFISLCAAKTFVALGLRKSIREQSKKNCQFCASNQNHLFHRE